MGIMDPSDDDQKEDKKPRFLQDLLVVGVVIGAALVYLLLDWLVF